MLEGEENRAGLRQLVEQVVKTHGISQIDESGKQTTKLLRKFFDTSAVKEVEKSFWQLHHFLIRISQGIP